MAITDLTGTKWLLNNSLTVGTSNFSYNLNFDTLVNDELQHCTYFGYNSMLRVYSVGESSHTQGIWRYITSGTWLITPAPPTFSITGGTAATNSATIAWFEANATQILPYSKVVFSDKVLIDLTEDTVDAAHLAEGYTAHNAKGEEIVGTMQGGGNVQITYDGTTREKYYVADHSDVTEVRWSDQSIPIPTERLDITANGTYDVTEKASAVVNVPNPSTGSISITANGTYDVTEKASAVVNVPNPSTGKLTITDTNVKDVTNYAQAQVVDANLVAENIKKDVTILGITGTHEGGGGGIPEPVLSDVTVVAQGGIVSVLTSSMGDTGLDLIGNINDGASGSFSNQICVAVKPFMPYPVSVSPLDGARLMLKILNGVAHPYAYYYIYKNCTFTINASCFLPDTLITLVDGSTKQAKDITYEDRLKVWDFDKGEFGEANICWLTKTGMKNNHYYKLTFSDGTVCKFTGDRSNHKIYYVDRKEFYGVAYAEIGDRIFSENGIVTITNKEYIEEECEYYNLITTGNINCFCNGILASDRYGNMYPIDENMKYIKGDRPIRPYSEFEPHRIKKYWYDNLRLGELTDSIDDIVNYIGKLECQMLPLPSEEVH